METFQNTSHVLKGASQHVTACFLMVTPVIKLNSSKAHVSYHWQEMQTANTADNMCWALTQKSKQISKTENSL